MEATAAVACRGGGVLARARPGHRTRRHGVGAGAGAAPVARRRLLVVASLGETPSAPARSAVAVAQEAIAALPTPARKEIPIAQIDDDDDDVSSAAILLHPDVKNLPSPDHVNTVRVKFVLEKQCAFGQRFLVVGDYPALGLWDPAKATALDWSEGHVWTARTDLPANKLVEFKFLLQDPSGQVRWQHGCNRTLRITGASNTLVVYEDWDDAECQKVSDEMDHLSIAAGEPIFAGSNDVLLMLADDSHIDEDQETNEGLMHAEKSPAAAEAYLRSEKTWVNGTNRPQFTLGKDDKVPDELRRRANSAAQNGSSLASAAGINGGNSILYGEGGAPVENRPAAGTFENDMVWIRKALQGWLQSLGFLIGTTKTWK